MRNQFASPTLYQATAGVRTATNTRKKQTNKKYTMEAKHRTNKKNSTNIRTEYEVMATDRDHQEVKRPSLRRHYNAPKLAQAEIKKRVFEKQFEEQPRSCACRYRTHARKARKRQPSLSSLSNETRDGGGGDACDYEETDVAAASRCHLEFMLAKPQSVITWSR